MVIISSFSTYTIVEDLVQYNARGVRPLILLFIIIYRYYIIMTYIMTKHEVSEDINEISITYKRNELDKEVLQEMLDYVIDCYNEDAV